MNNPVHGSDVPNTFQIYSLKYFSELKTGGGKHVSGLILSFLDTSVHAHLISFVTSYVV
jgi:hypothetical protein